MLKCGIALQCTLSDGIGPKLITHNYESIVKNAKYSFTRKYDVKRKYPWTICKRNTDSL